jgi:hypothetical protein
MEHPRALRGVLRELQRHGFKATTCDPRKGSHWMVTFDGVDGVQLLSANDGGKRAMRNTLARLRRAAHPAHR